ncbi:hypothetical protein BGZ76_008000 [Entomortierella beljakovae]|nr:hypothetical protein BGZ76_008000 [Entomortierella beljakovae]
MVLTARFCHRRIPYVWHMKVLILLFFKSDKLRYSTIYKIVALLQLLCKTSKWRFHPFCSLYCDCFIRTYEESADIRSRPRKPAEYLNEPNVEA